MARLLLALLAALLLASCRAGTAPLLAPTPAAETSPQPAEPTPAATATPAEAAAPPTEPPQYRMAVIVDYAAGTVDVAQHAVYTHHGPAALPDLVLVVDPAQRPGVFTLERVSVEGGMALDSWELAGGVLRLVPEEPIPPGATVILAVDYRLALPAAPGKLGFFNRQLNLADWHPFFPVHEPGTGWLAHPPHGIGETLAAGLADYEIEMVVENAPHGLRIAASAPGLFEDGVHTFEGRGYRNFVFSMGDNYEIARRQVGDVEVSSYYFPELSGAGQAALDAAADSIELFAELFGPYPHASYSLVAGNFPDGLEFDGLTFVSQDYYFWYDGSLQNYLVLLTVHEAAHQWFFMLVGSDPAREPWLDEALSIYSELLYLEARYPSLVGWWWTFRLDPYRPFEGRVDATVYEHDQFRPYVNAVYLRGADLMQALRDVMGDEAFFAALRAYVDRHRGGFARGTDFMGVMEEYSEPDLAPVWEHFFSP